MHETHLIDTILKYLEEEERSQSRKISKIYISLSEFGGLTEEHFRHHYDEAVAGSRWEKVAVEIKKIPYGPELEITKLDFA
jgi:Zn finger protein HypA/HybF involved in hydrogenase expression